MSVIVINKLSEPTEIDFVPASIARLTDEQIAALPTNRRQASMSIPPGRTELPDGTRVITSESYISVSVPAEAPAPLPPDAEAPVEAPARAKTRRSRKGSIAEDGNGS